MKKKLEADLISIAHRILKLKNKEDLTQLHLETQKLYEKLSVLKFVEDNFSDVKPTIGNSNIQELVNDALENEQEEVEVAVALEEIEIQPEIVEEIEDEVEEEMEEEETEEELEEKEEVEEVDEEDDFQNEEEVEEEENEEESEEEVEFEPHFELFNVEEVEDKKQKTEAKQISFEDLLGSNSEPVFERVFDPIQEETEEESEDEEAIFNPGFEMEASEEMEEEEVAIPNFEFDTEKSSNDSFVKTITFGLNDRIAFEKQLFAGSSEDLNRVVSQLSTFDTFEEAQNFIEDMVKPDYDNWEGKEEYVERFMEIVEKKFA
ncbi:MAG: hypothetical protein K9I35_01990 [Flavobacterium sp.]|jgi:hypothetical protein|nr:hypothetical protein [Flavobacterium sp.]